MYWIYHKHTFAGRVKNRMKGRREKEGKKYACEWDAFVGSMFTFVPLAGDL